MVQLTSFESKRSSTREFCRLNNIRRLYFFGSVLRDDFGPDSDKDVLVEFEPRTHVGLRFFELERELIELFGRKVDLNTPGFLSKYFRDEVLAEAVVQYDATDYDPPLSPLGKGGGDEVVANEKRRRAPLLTKEGVRGRLVRTETPSHDRSQNTKGNPLYPPLVRGEAEADTRIRE